MASVDLDISGMHCGSCVAHIERALRRSPGVRSASVNLATKQGRVEFDEQATGVEELAGVIRRAGYDARPTASHTAAPSHTGHAHSHVPTHSKADAAAHGDHAPHGDHAHHMVETDAAEVARWRWRTLTGAALGLPVVLLGMLWPTAASAWIQFALTLPLQGYIGWEYYRGAAKALRHGRADMDTLVALGTSAAFLYSTYILIASTASGGASHAGHQGVYFDTAAVILVLIALGKWMEARARGRASAAITSLMHLQPATATVQRDGRELELPVAEVIPGDVVLVRPGQRIAVDGQVIDGHSDVDESLVTGESVPVTKDAGTAVIGGSVNLTGSFRFRATKVGSDTLLARIVELVRRAQSSKARVQRLADAIAGWFVPVVLVIAAITVLAWGLAAGNWPRGIGAAIAVLIVACPCALGLATPAAIMVGTGLGARHGILIKDAAVLERAGRLTAAVLDKTGTLTVGRPAVTGIVPLQPETEYRELLRIAASLEAPSEHPLARAIVERARQEGVAPQPVTAFQSLTGGGVRASLDGREYFIGRPDQFPSSTDSQVQASIDQLRAQGNTVTILLELSPTPRLLGLIALADQLRPDAKDAVAALHQLGLRVLLLTGDHAAAAGAIAREVGIDDVLAEVRPAEKQAAVRRLQAEGQRVAMVGDGINDAPALAAADVGIAMGTGTDIAMEAGHVVLVGGTAGDLRLVPSAIRLSRAMMHRIRLGLFWAFVYNAVLIPVAALGYLHPMLAAAAMSFSSVSVVANALLLRRAKL